MGGLGSGRSASGRATVESFRNIDLARLECNNLTNAGDQQAIGSTLVELRRDGLLVYYFSPERAEEFVPFLYTAAKFGGQRRWFSCPRCRRRCRVLYRAQRFRCRKCLGVVYESTRQSWQQRMLDQADKLAFRVAGAKSAVYERDDFPDKPKRMRWTTYRRLEERYFQYLEAWGAAAMKRFGMKL